MKSKHLLIFFLTLPLFVFISWITLINYKISQGTEVSVRMRGYDPLDLISGRYLYLRPDWEQTDCTQFENNICPQEKFETSYRYYLPEYDAQKLDTALIRQNLKVDMIFSFNDVSKPMVTKLLINEKNWDEWIKEEQKNASKK